MDLGSEILTRGERSSGLAKRGAEKSFGVQQNLKEGDEKLSS
jgi:hypothetical protein